MGDGPLTVALERPKLVREAHAALDRMGAPIAPPNSTPSLAARIIAWEKIGGCEPELVGSKRAAEILGISPGNLRKVSNLPEPAQSLPRGDLWRLREIRQLARERARRRRNAGTDDAGHRGSTG